MEQKRGGRWYDAHPTLANQLDTLRDMEKGGRNRIIKGLRDLIARHAPGLIDRTVLEYPMTYKRRWYDRDPLTWLTINGLSYCGTECIDQAVSFLDTELSSRA